MKQFNHKLPNSTKECIRLLEYLGFERVKRIGIGGHQYKYINPNRKYIGDDNHPFVIVPHRYFNLLGVKLCKKLVCFGYSKEEIREGCERL